jgi:dihydroorotase
MIDAGSTGAYAFKAFRKFVIDGARTRIYALLNIATVGCCDQEIYVNPTYINAPLALRTIEENRDIILGVKVRIRGLHAELAHDISILKTAREVADAAGVPIMMHWSVEPELLAILKRGDILTHPFDPPTSRGNPANVFGSETQADTVLPQIRELKDRGIWTDGQLGTTHHTFLVSEKAMSQGWVPDAISTDVARNPDRTQASVLLPMSEYLHLGMKLEEVIERVTTIPAKMLNYPEKVGSLEPGSPADVAILELEQGNFEVADSNNPGPNTNKRVMRQRFAHVATVRTGVLFKPDAPV